MRKRPHLTVDDEVSALIDRELLLLEDDPVGQARAVDNLAILHADEASDRFRRHGRLTLPVVVRDPFRAHQAKGRLGVDDGRAVRAVLQLVEEVLTIFPRVEEVVAVRLVGHGGLAVPHDCELKHPLTTGDFHLHLKLLKSCSPHPKNRRRYTCFIKKIPICQPLHLT